MPFSSTLPYWRTTGPWGAGLGVDMVNPQPDTNMWTLLQNDEYLLALVNGFITTPPTSIADFITAGDQFYVLLTNSTMLGPYQLPSALWTVVPGGVWMPNTPYALNSVFTINGTTYLVIFPYPGASVFDPGANDSHGHNYFSPILTVPDNFLPTGGFNGQALTVIHPGGSGIPSTQWDYVLPSGGVATNFLKLVTPGSPTSAPGMVWAAVTGGDIADLSLESLNDVVITNPLTVGQALTWNVGGFWTNEFSGGSHGHGISLALEELSDYFTTSPVQIGDVVTWDGDAWTNAFPDVSVERLSDYNAYSPLEIGDVLTYVGGGWSNRPPAAGAVNVTTVHISSAELLGLVVSPVLIIPAQGAHTQICIIESFYATETGGYASGGGPGGLFYNSNPSAAADGGGDNSLPTGTGGFVIEGPNFGTFALAINQPVTYCNFNGAYLGGTSGIVLTVSWVAVPTV